VTVHLNNPFISKKCIFFGFSHYFCDLMPDMRVTCDLEVMCQVVQYICA
jgi:hypothetical protein